MYLSWLKETVTEAQDHLKIPPFQLQGKLQSHFLQLRSQNFKCNGNINEKKVVKKKKIFIDDNNFTSLFRECRDWLGCTCSLCCHFADFSFEKCLKIVQTH